MIEVEGLRYRYPQGREMVFPDFQVAKGGHALLLGESGSGKTTLLHLLAGLLRGATGRLVVAGTPLESLSETALDRFRGRHYGFIFQRNHLIGALSVKQNLALAPFLANLPVSEKRMDEVLEAMQIADKKEARIRELSQGQAQRVAIARAVINQPDLILADEPTSALDDQNCGRVLALLLQVAAQNNATLLIATHDQRLKSKIQNCIQL
jgi:putative ABC transport system ATP-binding protein